MVKLQDISGITEEEFNKFARLIHKKAGIHLKNSKINLLSNRLRSRMCEKGFTSYSDYYNYINSSNDVRELNRMLNAVSTNETYFFRNMRHFEALIEYIIPSLIEKGKTPLSIWCAGCSSGEEPKTIAMMLDDKGWMNRDTAVIKGSDINTDVLREASNGVYDTKRTRAVPPRFLERYFDRISENGYKVQRRVTDFIDFERINLVTEPFSKNYDIIFCRNVMIYFDKEDQRRVVNKMYKALKPGGYFFIGHSESLYFINSDFNYIKIKEAPLYQKPPE